MASQRFVLRKQKLQRKTSSIEVGSSDLIIDQKYYLKAPASIPLSNVAGVVRMHEVEVPDVITPRDVRVLDLPSSQYADPNIALFFGKPVRIPRFKIGSPQQLTISGKERRKGAEFDCITVNAEDADGLVRVLENRGVARFGSLEDALRSIYGEASGRQAAQRLEETERDFRKARLTQLGWGVVFLVFIVARFVIPEDGDASLSATAIVRIAVGAAVAALFAGLIAARLVPTDRAPQPRKVQDALSWWRAGALIAIPLGALAVLWGGQYLVSYIGPDLPRHLLRGAVLGAPVGGFIGWQFAALRPAKR